MNTKRKRKTKERKEPKNKKTHPDYGINRPPPRLKNRRNPRSTVNSVLDREIVVSKFEPQ